MKYHLFKVTTTLAVLLGLSLSSNAQFGPALVKVETVELREMAPIRLIPAFSKAKFVTIIKAESSGKVIDIADVGDQVAESEGLGIIADDDYALRTKELQNAIASEQANLDFLASESKRLQSMQLKNLTSQSALDKNDSDLKSSKANLAQAKSRLAQLINSIEKLTPKAPYDAFVTEQFAQPGQYIRQGDDFLKIMSKNNTELVAYLPIQLKAMIKKGSIWQYEDLNGEQFEATVVGFVPAATTNSRQIEVRLTDNSGQLIPGEPIKLWVPTSNSKTVLSVHRDALVLRKDSIFVYIVKDNKSIKTAVTTGIAQGDYIEISGEIQAGDQVVTRGNERMMPGQEVQILPAKD
ncbi:MAG: efflux RND transporter periplasmic adaptor subunit [Xanthomonadales bacterium]|nr:efflux RND transporter periplasmic adaptor subunit [Xanthomonadales bacterium]